MPDYRIYRIDDEGHVRGCPAVVTCETDEQAIEHASIYRNGMALEVWDGGRLVRRLEPQFAGLTIAS
jgi:hypothetical protein